MGTDRSLESAPAFVEANLSAADAFRQGLAHLRQGRHGEAEAYFRDALRVDPGYANAWVGISQVQSELGEIEKSCESARSALAIEPRLAEAHWRLGITLKGRLPDSDLRAIESLIDDKSMIPGAVAFLRFGLAAVLDDRGLYTEAAEQFEKANTLQSAVMAAQGVKHAPGGDSWFVNRMIAVFDQALLNRYRGWVRPDHRPVFVVGLQRSGTTLVEQVLSAHPRIYGAGELHDVGQIFQALPRLAGLLTGDSFDMLGFLGPETANAAARHYLDRLNQLAPATATRVVDKLPDNIRYLGLIALLWPGARVILCNRDLRDIAISCRLNGYAILWAKEWDHLAQRFAHYQRIVEHWRKLRPLDWLDVRYEDLVADLETQSRRMIEFIGLEWDPAILQFHASNRIVRTPSQVQVRQPIHTGSVGRWRHYEACLQPMHQAFQKFGVIVD